MDLSPEDLPDNVGELKALLLSTRGRKRVLDPGRGRTKTGYLWVIARDDRPWCGADPPAIAYLYAPGRGGKYAIAHLAGFSGTLQVDGYVMLLSERCRGSAVSTNVTSTGNARQRGGTPC
jgi:hypothetical protein